MFIDENEKLKRDLGNMINTEKAKVREMTHQQTLLEAEKKTVGELRADLANKKQSLVENRQLLVATNQELKTNAENIGQLSQQKARMEENIEIKRKELSHFEREHHAVRSRAQAQETKVQNLRQKLDVLNIRDKQLYGDVQHLEGKLTSKKKELEQSQEMVNQITKNIRNAEERGSKGRNVIAITGGELSSIDQRIRQASEQIADTERIFHETSKALHQSNDKFANNQTLKATNFQRLEKLEETITKLKEYHCEQQQKYEEIAAAIVKRELERREKMKINNNNNSNTVLNEQVKRRN
jgi:chromosome segregation ATPase